jgi:hypothetical protein
MKTKPKTTWFRTSLILMHWKGNGLSNSKRLNALLCLFSWDKLSCESNASQRWTSDSITPSRVRDEAEVLNLGLVGVHYKISPPHDNIEFFNAVWSLETSFNLFKNVFTCTTREKRRRLCSWSPEVCCFPVA